MDKNQNEAQGQAELELNDDQIARNDEYVMRYLSCAKS